MMTGQIGMVIPPSLAIDMTATHAAAGWTVVGLLAILGVVLALASVGSPARTLTSARSTIALDDAEEEFPRKVA